MKVLGLITGILIVLQTIFYILLNLSLLGDMVIPPFVFAITNVPFILLGVLIVLLSLKREN